MVTIATICMGIFLIQHNAHVVTVWYYDLRQPPSWYSYTYLSIYTSIYTSINTAPEGPGGEAFISRRPGSKGLKHPIKNNLLRT